MNAAERADFRNYCRTLTTEQVREVVEKETELFKRAPKATDHRICREIAEHELEVRASAERR